MRQRKKKTRFFLKLLCLFLVLGTAVLLLFLAGRGFFQNQTPEALLKSYVDCLGQGKYEEMYAFLSEKAREQIAEEDFIKRNKNIYQGIEANNFQVVTGEKEKNGDQTILNFELTMDTLAGSMTVENRAFFSKPFLKGYELDWSSRLIFPDLDAEDRVSVNRIPAVRGCIYDRNGMLLAGPQTALEIGVVPERMDGQRELEIRELAEILDITEDSIKNKLSASWVKDDSYVPIWTIPGFTKEDAAFYAQAEASEKRGTFTRLDGLPGVILKNKEVRGYPLGEAAAHLVGYVQSVTAEDLEKHKGEGYGSTSVIGRSGAESLYEKDLKGKDGFQIKILTRNGVEKKVLAASFKEDGKDITLTIDSQLQQDLYMAFAQDKGTSAAINLKTGEVLALVSTPAYNNNQFVTGMSDQEWDSLNKDERNPMQNRFRAVWSPGSSFKPVIGAIGLTAGLLDPAEDLVMEGERWQKDQTWGNYFVTTLHTYETANLENALVYSDNIYFAKAALKIGEETLIRQFKNLGFGELLPFPIQMTQSQFSNSQGFESEIQLADTGYGQGQVLLNPLHLAVIYSAFVNQGNMIQPTLLKEEATPSFWKEQVFTGEAAQEIDHDLRQVIENPNGTGHRAYLEGVSLAGKTGTAEIKLDQKDTKGTELGWFVAYTPEAEADQSICIVSMVEDVKERGGSGYVLEPVREVLKKYLTFS